MAFDEDRPATGPEMVCVMKPFDEESDVKEDELPVSVLTDLLVRLMALPSELRDIVCWRFVGLTYPEIGKKHRVTSAGAEARHRRAMRMFPELRELFIVKTAKRKMRRKSAGQVKGSVSG
jgi:DNA-directed RNA polymerase specialized sigma24 family protein